MIYVSHQMVEIQRLCSQMVRIEDGRVVETADLEMLPHATDPIESVH